MKPELVDGERISKYVITQGKAGMGGEDYFEAPKVRSWMPPVSPHRGGGTHWGEPSEGSRGRGPRAAPGRTHFASLGQRSVLPRRGDASGREHGFHAGYSQIRGDLLK
jgi:hypothetical protein